MLSAWMIGGRTTIALRTQALRDFEWLVDREDEEGFRLFLQAYEIEEGTEQYETAFEAWRERLIERQQRRSHF